MEKQLFYLTNDRLAAYAWSRKALVFIAAFANDEQGREAFSAHVAQSQIPSAALLVDLIEEDFQHDTIPHVLGGARQALIQRRLAQIYRDTPYRSAQFQLRERTGRKDDRMLFSALTNVDILKPWMDIITQHRVPLIGIYSPALLSPFLFKRIGLHDDHALILTHQSGGVRQNYFYQGQFRFSRMTPLADTQPETVAAVTQQEVAKTRQFLASTRLLPRDAPLAMVTVADEHYRGAFEDTFSTTPAAVHRFIDLHEMAQLLQLRQPIDATFCEPVLLMLLALRPPATHYPTFDAGRLLQMERARLALYSAGALIALGGAVWTADNVKDSFEAYRDSVQLAIEAQAADAHYRSIIASLPASADKPHEMSLAVAAEQLIKRNEPDPQMLATVISHALDASPQVRINRLHWEVSATNPADAATAVPQASAADSQPSGALLGIPAPPFQVAVIEGEVVPFAQNYRTALDSVNHFVDDLRKNTQLKVNITRAPIDVSPTVRLEGEIGSDKPDAKAEFALKLIWTPAP